ncbi:hypothetical protein Tco_1513327, partial [Tanacetum coccineum]
MQGKPQQDDTGFVDSGCSRHMTGNIAYLIDFKEFDGGYVTFGGRAHGGRISSKGTLKTDSLDFEDLPDEIQILLKILRKDNMYSFDMKNIVPKETLTCLVAKATYEESMLCGIRACALRNFDQGKMELENSQNNALAKLPMLKLGEYKMWEIRIKQYFQIQYYALWEVIENGNSWVPILVTAPESGPSTALKT